MLFTGKKKHTNHNFLSLSHIINNRSAFYVRRLGLYSQLYHELTQNPWASHIHSWDLNFLMLNQMISEYFCCSHLFCDFVIKHLEGKHCVSCAQCLVHYLACGQNSISIVQCWTKCMSELINSIPIFKVSKLSPKEVKQYF